MMGGGFATLFDCFDGRPIPNCERKTRRAQHHYLFAKIDDREASASSTLPRLFRLKTCLWINTHVSIFNFNFNFVIKEQQ